MNWTVVYLNFLIEELILSKRFDEQDNQVLGFFNMDYLETFDN